MKPRAVRFLDTRRDRFAMHPFQRKDAKKFCRAMSRVMAAHFKAFRQDRKFALPHLIAALTKNSYSLECSIFGFTARWYRPLHEGVAFDFDQNIPGDCVHFAAAHRAKCDPQKIACYPTRADAKRGREIVMAPGRFFAACMPRLTAAEVQRLAEKFIDAGKPPVIHYATSADEWAAVYSKARGFGSCMTNSRWSACDELHPVRFYAHPDNALSLAYLTHDNKPDGDTVARCIVNTDNQKMVRVYGDARLENALFKEGFSYDAQRALVGQKCNALEENGRLVAPYIDGGCNTVAWNGRADYCVISESGDYTCDNQDGYATGEDRVDCDECGESVPSDSTIYSEWHSMTICECCADTEFVRAIVHRRGYRDLIKNDEAIEVAGEFYADDADLLSSFNFVFTADSEWREMDECIYLEYLSEWELCENCVELSVPFNGDEYALISDTKTVNGRVLHIDAEEDEEEEEGEGA